MLKNVKTNNMIKNIRANIETNVKQKNVVKR